MVFNLIVIGTGWGIVVVVVAALVAGLGRGCTGLIRPLSSRCPSPLEVFTVAVISVHVAPLSTSVCPESKLI